MKCLKNYRDEDKKKGYIQRNKDRYYNPSRKSAYAARSLWSEEDIDLVMKHEIPDTVLAKKIGRSVGAIQHIRHLRKLNIR